MELNIGSMMLNGTKMNNVTLSGVSTDDFLKLLQNNSPQENVPEKNKTPVNGKYDPSKPAKSIRLIHLKTGEVSVYKSLTTAAKDIGVAQSTVSKSLHGDGIIKKTWKVEPFDYEPTPVKADHVSFSDFSAELRFLISNKNQDVGKILSEAYDLETKLYGINWDKAKKDYLHSTGNTGTTIQVAFWIEDSGVYGNFKGRLKECVEKVLNKLN